MTCFLSFHVWFTPHIYTFTYLRRSTVFFHIVRYVINKSNVVVAVTSMWNRRNVERIGTRLKAYLGVPLPLKFRSRSNIVPSVQPTHCKHLLKVAWTTHHSRLICYDIKQTWLKVAFSKATLNNTNTNVDCNSNFGPLRQLSP